MTTKTKPKPKTGKINSPVMLTPLDPTPAQIEKFKNSIDFSGGCWLWKSGKNNKGYGQVHSRVANGTSRTVPAHRLAHVVFSGIQPLNQIIRHQCGNPACVRPSHSKLGTPMDNHLDAVKDGTTVAGTRGEANPASKLTWSDVAEIRRAFKAKEMNQVELARKFGVGTSRIACVIYNETWADQGYQPPQKVKAHKFLTDSEIKQMRKLRSEGKTLMQIAEKTGRGESTVRRHLSS